MQKPEPRLFHLLIPYYGLLQALHLGALARAGLLILRGNPAPFPILPPPGGWTNQTMAFLYGLAFTDLIGIVFGILFSTQFVFEDKFNTRLGTLSLTIFITGAIVFTAGTFPSGAWAAHPVAYGVLIVLFAPCVILYCHLLKQLPDHKSSN